MPFEKRVCVLKQVKKGFTADGSALSGAVYCERLGEEVTVMPRLLGIAPVKEGYYALALWIAGGVYVVKLDGGINFHITAPSVKAGLAVLLVFVRGGEVTPVAFGNCGAAPANYAPILAELQSRERAERKKKPPMPLPPTELPTFSPNNIPLAPTVPVPEEPFREDEKYDDEAIATENFYCEHAVHEDGEAETPGAGEAGENATGHVPTKDGETLHPFRVTAGGLTYYNTVREKLTQAFSRFERDTRLSAVFPCSEWVKAEGALLGIIYEGGLPRYLCVAVEANGEPPAEMKEHCQFVPESPLSDMVGFYVVFQSADTGEYVTVSES